MTFVGVLVAFLEEQNSRKPDYNSGRKVHICTFKPTFHVMANTLLWIDNWLQQEDK